MSPRARTRADDRKLLADLIAQATNDQETGAVAWSRKTESLVEQLLTRMGHTPPSRVNLDGLNGLFEELATEKHGECHHYPIVFRTPHGVMYRWVTVDVQDVAFGDEGYRAAVISLTDD